MAFLDGRSPFLIAEAGVNHNGDPALALRLVDAAVDAGADAVKFQTFRAESLASASAQKAEYQKETTGDGGGQLEMLRALELSEEAHRRIRERCLEKGIRFLSTAFDEKSADFLDSLGMEWFKIPSGELTNLPFLEHLAAKRKPLLLSTGMASMDEVTTAVETIRRAGGNELAVLHCVSSYPAEPRESNLRALATLRDAFGVPVGWSDHTAGFETSVAAVALGAAVLEKHFTLDKTLPGPDHRMSLDAGELKGYVRAVRTAADALGDGIKRPRPCELPIRDVARRSIVTGRSCPKGTVLDKAALAFKRPGTGIPPSALKKIIGRVLTRDLPADSILSWDDLEGD